MKYKRSIALLCIVIIIVLFTGCSRTDYAENQAYAVILGIDIDEEDNIIITAKYPKLSGSSGGASGGGSNDSSAYSTTGASGDSFQQALNNLRVITPREINLSALTLIIISEKAVDSGRLYHILEQLSANYRMYSSAYIAICEGEAGKFIEKQEPQIGSRLSEGLKALIENAERLGSIPDSRMADVSYGLDSFYSDPIIMLCSLKEDSKSGNIAPPSDNIATDGDTLYYGSCIIKDGRIAVKFDEHETVIANMLKGDVQQFSYTNENDSAFISVDSKPSIKLDIKNDIPVIKIKLNLSVMVTSGTADANTFGKMIKSDAVSVINECRSTGAEPFGFADRAAGRFASLEKWESYDWHTQFKQSEFDIEVSVTEIF